VAFPQTPLAIVVKLRIAGVLTTITSDVMGLELGNAISVTGYGATDERSQTDPAVIAFDLKNWADAAVSRVAGQYTNDNPRSPYYGQLGMNTEYQILVDSVIRYTGRIYSWTPGVDETGRFMIMKVRAGLAKTFLTQGAATILSPIHRSTLRGGTTAPAPLAYWPMEDPAGSTLITSAFPTGTAILPTGPVVFAADSDLPGSAPLPLPNDGVMIRAKVPRFATTWSASTIGWSFAWVMKISDLPASTQIIARWHSDTGPIRRGEVSLSSAGTVSVKGYNSSGTLVLIDTPTNIGILNNEFVGKWAAWSLIAQPIGADTFVSVSRARMDHPPLPGQSSGSVTVSTFASLTGAFPDQPAVIELITSVSGTGFGHLAVWPESFDFLDTDAAFGWLGENAAQRMTRVCAEEGIPLNLICMDGSVDFSNPIDVALGAQRRGTVLDVLHEVAEADGGILFETRDVLDGLTYIARERLYDQAPVLALNYSLGHISDPFEPTFDNQSIENTVTVTGVGGGGATLGAGATARLETGALSIQAPPNGVGVYDRGGRTLSLYDDSEFILLARWLLGLGTADQRLRVPSLTVQLQRQPWATDAVLSASAVALDVGSAITLDGLLTARPDLPPDLAALQIRGYTEVLSQYQRDLTFNVVPGWPWEVWQMETSGSTLVAGVNSSATSLKVATSSGPEWNRFITPYHIQIDGEALTVTAVSLDTPTVIASGTVAHGNNASVVPGMPAGMTPDVGQLLLLFAAIRNAGAGVPNTPTGYTRLPIFTASDNAQVFARYYVTGDTAPTVGFTGGVANADTSARIMGWSGLSMELDNSVAQLNGSAQNIAYPYLRVRRENNVTFYFSWKQDDWTNASGPKTEVFDNPTALGDDQGIALDRDIQTSPVDALPGAIVITGGVSAISLGSVFALRPLQTLTVTRSVNGIVKSLAAAKPVKGWRLGVTAL